MKLILLSAQCTDSILHGGKVQSYRRCMPWMEDLILYTQDGADWHARVLLAELGADVIRNNNTRKMHMVEGYLHLNLYVYWRGWPTAYGYCDAIFSVY